MHCILQQLPRVRHALVGQAQSKLIVPLAQEGTHEFEEETHYACLRSCCWPGQVPGMLARHSFDAPDSSTHPGCSSVGGQGYRDVRRKDATHHLPGVSAVYSFLVRFASPD